MSCSLATQAFGEPGDKFRDSARFLFFGSSLISENLDKFAEPERLVKRLCDMWSRGRHLYIIFFYNIMKIYLQSWSFS